MPRVREGERRERIQAVINKITEEHKQINKIE